jgi:hypothetical protein
MKNFIMLFVCACLSIFASAQHHLRVTHNKTTNVVFPAAIAGIDRGSQDIAVQKATGAENILKVKAQAPGFSETNLSVITGDGKLYTFTVNYDAAPSELTITIDNAGKNDGVSSLLVTATGAAENISIRKNSGDVRIELTGAYVHGDFLLFRYRISNASALDYDVDQLRFYIKDRKRSKRTAQQETEISPLQLLGEKEKVKSGSRSVLVIAVPKFTLSEAQEFVTQVQEVNGARHFDLSVKSSHLKNVLTIN